MQKRLPRLVNNSSCENGNFLKLNEKFLQLFTEFFFAIYGDFLMVNKFF